MNRIMDKRMRRVYLPYQTKVESLLHQANLEVESIGVDERLTQAQQLINQAKNLIGDYMDEQLGIIRNVYTPGELTKEQVIAAEMKVDTTLMGPTL